MAAPAFQLYGDDFIGGTVTFSNDEKGLYISLLCVQWSKGFVTRLDVKRLSYSHGSAMAQPSVKLVASKFTVGPDGHLRNGRMEKERVKQEAFRRNRQQSGQKGGISRWHKDGKLMAQPIAEPLAPPSAADSKPIASDLRTPISGCTEREREGGAAPNSGSESGGSAASPLAAQVKAGAIRFGALSNRIKIFEALRARKELDDVGRAELKKLRAELAELQKKHAAGDFES